MPSDSGEFSCDLLRGQYKVNTPRTGCATRHAVELCRLLVLGEGDSSARLDGSATFRAIRSCARKDHADGLVAAFLRKRKKEMIDGQVLSTYQGARSEMEFPIPQQHSGICRNHVNSVGNDLQAVHHFDDGDFGGTRENLGKDAAMGRI